MLKTFRFSVWKWGIPCLMGAALFAACEIPESVSIRGSPGVYMHLGNPLVVKDKNGKESNPLLENLNMADLKSQIEESFKDNDGIELYNYRYSSIVMPDNSTVDGADLNDGVQTFLIRFKALNIEEPIGIKVDDPSISAGLQIPPSFSQLPWDQVPDNFKTVPIDLPLGIKEDTSIKKFVINDGGTGKWTTVTLQGAATAKDAIKLAIPALGIADSFGTVPPGTTDLMFTATMEKTFNLEDNQGITATFTFVTNPEISGNIKMDFDLKWKEAELYLNDTDLPKIQGGDIPAPSLGNLTEYLGGLKFKAIPAYLYVNIDTAASLPLGIKIWSEAKNGTKDYLAGEESGVNEYKDISPKALPTPLSENDAYTKSLAGSSIPSFDAVTVFGDKDMTLKYDINFLDTYRTITIKNSTETPVCRVQVDMVIVLPFDFEITEGDTISDESGNNYIKLNIKGVDDFNKNSDSGKDLLGRNNKDDDLMNVKGFDVQNIDIYFNNIRNSLSNDLSFGFIEERSGSEPNFLLPPVNFDKPSQIISITKAELGFPFVPQVTLMVRDDGSGNGRFRIKPIETDKAYFDLQLAMGIKTRLDINPDKL